MKKFSHLIIVFFTAITALAQDEKPVDSKITNVTVFLNKAQVTREAKVRLESGKTNLVLKGLTAQLDQQSIQVTGKGDFTILGIAHSQNYINELNTPKSLMILKDSADHIQRQLILENSQKEILNKEEQMLVSNQKIGGANQNLTVAELKAMADFYRNRLGDIVGTRMKHDVTIKKLNEKLLKLQRQINEQNDLFARNTSEIVISVSAFDIALPYTVSSANKPTLVDIRNHELQADYSYAVAPKFDEDAFLLARSTGWEDFSLLPGEANIFFEGTFVGKSYIDPNNIKDTLSVSLGRDKRIIVKREKLKDFSSRKLIGTNQRDNYAYEISVRNAKNEPAKLIIEDQIPISQNSQIEVSSLDLGGAKFNKDTGKLLWEITLEPNKSAKVTYKFEIKYPKDKSIPGLD